MILLNEPRITEHIKCLYEIVVHAICGRSIQIYGLIFNPSWEFKTRQRLQVEVYCSLELNMRTIYLMYLIYRWAYIFRIPVSKKKKKNEK